MHIPCTMIKLLFILIYWLVMLLCTFCVVLDEDVNECGCIEDDKPIEELRSEPYTLPQGFVWDTLDISDEKVVCTALFLCLVDNVENMLVISFYSWEKPVQMWVMVLLAISSPSQTLAACQLNISQHRWAQHVACVWSPCCYMLPNVLGVVGSSLKMVKFELTTANVLQHIATVWPYVRSMLRPTRLQYVALTCECLAKD